MPLFFVVGQHHALVATQERLQANEWIFPMDLACMCVTKCVYMCVTKCVYMCHQMRLHVCHQTRSHVCHEFATELASLARFFNNLN